MNINYSQSGPAYNAEKELSRLYSAIADRPAFSYDAAKDPIFRSYADRYAAQGRRAMADTMGKSAALTGGYSSSYAQSAGQQQYNEYLRSLEEVLPQLYSLAYQKYSDEGEALQDAYDMAFEKNESDYQKQLSAVVAKVYVLREKFTIELDNMKNEAVAEYKAIPEADRTSGKLTDFAKKYVKRAAELEKQCDSEMDAIVGELDALIRANNGDHSIIDTVIETYASEKSLKKAWYMAELKKRGFVV